ncbi:translation elongation factor Ts, partial [Burkholderia multivorans]
YTAADIKELREKTGAGMMDVKKALDEADGDQAKAIELLRVKGLKGATKREGRATSDGPAATFLDSGVGTMIELDSETDFVAKSQRFIDLADEVLALAVSNKSESAESLLSVEADGKTVAQFITESGAALGEKVDLRRVGR